MHKGRWRCEKAKDVDENEERTIRNGVIECVERRNEILESGGEDSRHDDSKGTRGG
jgi:hypothetical protein